MDSKDFLAQQFDAQRSQLRSVAYRILGSLGDADDAVQEAWLRLNRTDADGIRNLGAWLTTVVGRVCLDMLRARKAHSEDSFEVLVPDPVVSRDDGSNPEEQAVLADSVGLALLVVLETLSPAERLAFVLHDLFAVPFEEIGPIVDRTPAAARQLASRARRRVHGVASDDGAWVGAVRQRELVQAFVAASRDGDFGALLELLDPGVVLRLDRGGIPAGASKEVSGAEAVVGLGFRFSGDGWSSEPAIVNGVPGVLIARGGKIFAVAGFTIGGGKITEINILADPARIRRLGLNAGR